MTERKPIHLLGVRINPVTLSELHDAIANAINTRRQARIFHVNIHAMNIACTNPDFRSILNSAELVFCDGFGVKWGARLLRLHIPTRITYADWIYQLAMFCQEREYSLFLLGSRPGISARAAQQLTVKYPRLRIGGTHHGYFDKAGTENDQVIAEINAVQPNIVLVGFGMPLQEQWIASNYQRINAQVFLSCGACFDYVAAEVPRGPRWMVDHGLEWLFRLLLEPRRMWRRYLIGNLVFLLRLLWYSLHSVEGSNQKVLYDTQCRKDHVK